MISVSIIIPVYNVESYIEKCLQSVMSQTYQGDMECILVDDCGSDNSIKIAEETIAQYTGPISFSIIHHNVNKGLPAARNTGIKHAKGGWLFFMDSDDYISDSCIEKMIAWVEQDSSIQMVIGNTLPVPSTEMNLRHHDLKYRNLPEKYMDNASIRKKFYDLQSSLPYYAWNKLINYDFLIRNNLFFREGLICNEDVHWTYFVYRKLEFVAFLGDYTYIHVSNPGSIMHTMIERKNADCWAIVIDDFLNSLDADYFHIQFNYCFRYFRPWYMNFSDLDSYRHLYRRFLLIAFKNFEVKIAAILCLMQVKLFLMSIIGTGK